MSLSDGHTRSHLENFHEKNQSKQLLKRERNPWVRSTAKPVFMRFPWAKGWGGSQSSTLGGLLLLFVAARRAFLPFSSTDNKAQINRSINYPHCYTGAVLC
jgi:hypothetical protein